MAALRPSHRAVWLLPALLLLAGCPIFTPPLLHVSPGAIFFEATDLTRTIQLSNAGSGTLSWSIEEVAQSAEGMPWVAQDIPWLSIDGATTGSITNEVESIRLRVDRSGLPVGRQSGAGVRIVATNGNTAVVPVSLDVAPSLVVEPTTITLGQDDTKGSFVISNIGNEALVWTLRLLLDPAQPDLTRDLPADFSVNPGVSQSLAAATSVAVEVSWTESREEFYLLVDSSGGSSVVRFVRGAPLEGIEVSPSPLTLFVETTEVPAGQTPPESTPSVLHIQNVDSVSRTWTLEAVNLLNPGVSAPITIGTPASQTAAGETTDVDVVVNDVTAVEAGSGFYKLVISSDGASMDIPIVVEIMALPVIAISSPPQESTSRPEVVPLPVLDFGQEETQQEFYIANVGPLSSNLYFRITHDDQGAANPVIVDVRPLTGDANGPGEVFFHPTEGNVLIDGVPIMVTVDRRNLVEDVEFRTITVEATDPLFENTLDSVDVQTIQVRVERKPLTIEGAMNRSRPPYVMRFVFLLRDTVGEVIPTRTPEDLARIAFSVTEDGQALDLNETNQFLTGPENLKVNLVLMLDYTGSMFNAGVDDPVSPLQPGEALARVKDAALRFLDDLPPSYRVALMYYHKRQQQNRVLHAFSTDRASLRAALDNFTLADSEHLQSDIRDALENAVQLLVAEDSGDALPFDEADLRAVLFITDGVDNSSVTELNTLVDDAKEARVRLYPLGYAPMESVNMADMLVMAEETGGALYNAGDIQGLLDLLANNQGLALDTANTTAPNAVAFQVANVSTTPLVWSLDGHEGVPWIQDVSPVSGILNGRASQTVTVTLDPSAASGIVEQPLSLTSQRGEATALLRLDQSSVPAAISLSLHDEPGLVWEELQNQLVFTYITPSQVGGSYTITTTYEVRENESIAGQFERDGVFFPGTDIAGQLSMSTTGIYTDTDEASDSVEVYVRADYVPPGVSNFRLRFFVEAPDDISTNLARVLLDNYAIDVEIVEGGLLAPDDPFAPQWWLIRENDGIFRLVTGENTPLAYGAFGNLVKVTITGIRDYINAFAGQPRQPEFFLSMRVDNDLYVSPATKTRPSETKYFLYPSGPTYPERKLVITTTSDLAPAALSAQDLAFPGIDPEAEFAWDRDEDGLPDFNDPAPDDEAIPSSIATPETLEISGGDTRVQFRVLNNRLDTFTWSIDVDSLPAWANTITYGSDPDHPTERRATLGPGESEYVNITVDRTGFSPGSLVRGEFDIETDLFGAVRVKLTTLVN